MKISLLALALAAAALAQNAAERPSAAVLRVGHRLACKCGCNDTVATCEMLECSFSRPAKVRIAKMLAAGMSDQQIIDQFIADYGADIYRGEPSAFGWAVPYGSLVLGLGIIALILRRYMKSRPVPELGPAPEDASLAKYHEQIEKDLAQMD